MKQTLSLSAAALAVLTFCATSAQAQSNNVQLYGLLVPMIDHISVSDAASTAPANRPSMLPASSYNGAGNYSVNRMQSSTSNWGMRGTEDLGGGLSTIFQLESGMGVDDGTLTGGPAAASRFFNRNTRVGLSSRTWGTVFAGSWDTPSAWSHLGLTNGVRNPYAGDSSVIFATPGFNVGSSVTADTRTNSASDATFNRRQGNSVQYWTPSWAGLSMRVSYSLPEAEKTAANGSKYKASVAGFGAEYIIGGLMLRYAYQQQNDYFGVAWIGSNAAANPDSTGSTATGSKDVNHRLIARYTVTPNWTVQGTFDRVDYQADNVAAGGINEYSRNAWAALVQFRDGAHSAWANYGMASDGSCSRAGSSACSTTDVGAATWALGYRYDFSKRTDVFTSVYQVRNRANGQYGVFPRSVAGIAPGTTQTGLTVGIEHSF
ncbi:porin [Variovorax sp. HJSM1_2]|uniref:porin n=1 Tax=Variovorax sp. HJSM1_2 TaxID=3366263 RepID=UPI003BE56C1C